MKLTKKTDQRSGNYLGKNLNYLLKKQKITAEELGKKINIKLPTLASLKAKQTNPTIATVQPIADYFQITLDRLLNEDLSDNEHTMLQPQGCALPIINLADTVNWPFSANFENWITADSNMNTNGFAVILENEILAPKYDKGAVLIIDPDTEPQDGNIVLVKLDNKSTPTFRQLFVDQAQFFFKPVNPDFGKIKIYESYQIIGTLVRVIYNLDEKN